METQIQSMCASIANKDLTIIKQKEVIKKLQDQLRDSNSVAKKANYDRQRSPLEALPLKNQFSFSATDNASASTYES